MNEIIKKVLSEVDKFMPEMHIRSFEKGNQNSKKQNIEHIFFKTN